MKTPYPNNIPRNNKIIKASIITPTLLFLEANLSSLGKRGIVEGRIIVDEEPSKVNETCFCVKNFRYVIEEIPSGDYTFVLNGNDYGLIRIY